MELHTVALLLFFYGAAVIEAKESLRTGGGDIIAVPEDTADGNPSKVMALVIVEDIDELEDTINPSMKYEASMLPWIENPQIMLPWIESVKPKDYEEDTSGEPNSDEYPDSDDELDSDSESSYYHEDDYLKDKIMDEIKLLDVEKNHFKALRNRWKSCQRKASKYCRDACVASYKNACTEQKCKKKLKKLFKRECKQNCKDIFTN